MTIFLIAILTIGIVIWFVVSVNKLMKIEDQVLTRRNNVQIIVDRRYVTLETVIKSLEVQTDELKEVTSKVMSLRLETNPENIKSYIEMDDLLTKCIYLIDDLLLDNPHLKNKVDIPKYQTSIEQQDSDFVVAKFAYNDVVTQYNKMIKRMPYSLVAGRRAKHSHW